MIRGSSTAQRPLCYSITDCLRAHDRQSLLLPSNIQGAHNGGQMYKLLSFDVYGTLVNTPPANAKAFQAILLDAGAANVDALAFYNFWESRNIAHYVEPYRSYKAICRTSLEEAFAHFKIAGADPALIGHFFDVCREMQLYPDVLPTLES